MPNEDKILSDGPRGPKDQKNSRFRSRLKISIENEIFERATHRGPIFCGEIEASRSKFSSEIKNFDRDQKFRSRSNFFDRWALWSRAAKRGCFKRGGFPIWTCPSFFVLFCPFWDFPDFSGIFPICSGMVRGFSRFALVLFLGLLRAPTRNSPERVRDTIGTFPEKSGKHPGLETPLFSFSQSGVCCDRKALTIYNIVMILENLLRLVLPCGLFLFCEVIFRDPPKILRSCRAGMAWKTAKFRKWKKNGNRNGKRPQAGQGQKWQKMAQKWIFKGVFHYFSIFGPFFAIFAPVQLGAVFPFDFHFFSISAIWPFSMPYQPGRIATKIPFKTSIKWTFLRLVLPRKVIFALQGKRLKITPKDS